MKSIFFFLIFQTVACAASYEHYIAHISEDGGRITLDNGFTWDVIVPLLFDDDREHVKQWLPGDEVAMRFRPFDTNDHRKISFYLVNLRTYDYAWVKYGKQDNLWQTLTIDSIQSNGQLTLSDGSRWKSWDSYPTNQWKQGDHVLVYRYKRYKNHYVLVNPDLGLHHLSYDDSGVYATLINNLGSQ